MPSNFFILELSVIKSNIKVQYTGFFKPIRHPRGVKLNFYECPPRGQAVRTAAHFFGQKQTILGINCILVDSNYIPTQFYHAKHE